MRGQHVCNDYELMVNSLEGFGMFFYFFWTSAVFVSSLNRRLSIDAFCSLMFFMAISTLSKRRSIASRCGSGYVFMSCVTVAAMPIIVCSVMVVEDTMEIVKNGKVK